MKIYKNDKDKNNNKDFKNITKKACSSIRETAINVRKLAADFKTSTIGDVTAKSIQHANMLETTHMQEMTKILCSDPAEHCDKDVKKVTRKIILK